MNKEFIPYEQALELKELGFNEECLAKYVPHLSESGWRLELYTGGMQFSNSWLEQGFSAPLYQQAFRWFREKYELDIQIRGTHFRASYVISIPKDINYDSADGHPLVIDWDCIVDESGKTKTYEEAELSCLKKLIEIVKNK